MTTFIKKPLISLLPYQVDSETKKDFFHSRLKALPSCMKPSSSTPQSRHMFNDVELGLNFIPQEGRPTASKEKVVIILFFLLTENTRSVSRKESYPVSYFELL